MRGGWRTVETRIVDKAGMKERKVGVGVGGG